MERQPAVSFEERMAQRKTERLERKKERQARIEKEVFRQNIEDNKNTLKDLETRRNLPIGGGEDWLVNISEQEEGILNEYPPFRNQGIHETRHHDRIRKRKEDTLE